MASSQMHNNSLNLRISPYVFAYRCICYITRTKLVLYIQKGAISPYAFAYRGICYITRTKLVLCIQNGAVSPYVFAYCCIRYITRTKLVLCIQKGAISPYVFAYCCIRYITRTKLVLCIQKGERSPMSLPRGGISGTNLVQMCRWASSYPPYKCILEYGKSIPINVYTIIGDNNKYSLFPLRLGSFMQTLTNSVKYWIIN